MPPLEPEIEIIGPDGVPVGVVRRPLPPPDRIWLHVLLLLATFVTTTLVGGLAFAEVPERFHPTSFWQLLFDPAVIRGGLWFSIPLLVILLSHEMGHYISCRVHGLDATLPFFLPVPFGIGTFGAFIRIRTPLSDKRELFDVGASGPLVGFIVTIPVLLAGVARIAEERDCRRLDLWVLHWNPARQFYERIGMADMKDWRPYRLSGEGLTQLAAEAGDGSWIEGP